MSNLNTLLMFSPILIGFFKEFPILQKNFKYSVAKGYAYLVGLPILFIYISNEAIKEAFKSSGYLTIISVITLVLSYILSSIYFNYRIKSQHIDYGTEKWFMTRFYRDTLYSILISIPALVMFYLVR